MRSRSHFATIGLLVAFASLVNCGGEPTAPGADAARGARANGISFRAVFPAALSAAGVAVADLVPFTNVRVVLRHPDGTIALDTLVNFPAGAESLQLSLDVRLLPGAPASGEAMSLTLNYQNSAGVTVFTGGPVTVQATPSALGVATAQPVTVPVVYTGPGANATKVVITPKTLSVASGGTFQFTAQAFDASNNVIANTPIAFTSSNAALATIASAASGSGTAGSGRGAVQVTAALLTGGLTDVATLTVQPVATSISVTSGSGQSATVGSALAQPVVVKVLAADGVGVSGVPVTFAASNLGIVSPTTTITDAAGNAQTSWTLGNGAGAQTLTASATGFAFTATATATANPRPATKLAIVQQPSSSAVNAPLSLSVSAQDATGATVTTFTGAVTVALANNTAGATLGGTTTVNAVAGVATFSGLTLNRTGSAYTIVASSGTLASATTNAFDITTGSPASISVLGGGGQTAPQGTALPQPIVVLVTDAAGNALNGVAVQFTVTTGGGSVTPATVVTNAQGRASTTWTLGSTVGAQSLSAASGALSPATIGATATATVSPVTQLSVSGPASVTAGATLTTTVTARNDSGNVVTSFNGAVTLAFGSNPAGGTLSGTTTANAVNGVATFSNSITRASNGYTLVASNGTVNSSPASRTVTAATPATLTLVSGDAQTGTVSQPLPSPVVVALSDTYGNRTPGQTVTFAVVSGGGSVSPTSVSADTGGRASTTWTLGSTVGSQSMSASATGVSPITITATGTAAPAGPATQLLISTSPGTVTAGSAFTVVVQARDAGGLVATSYNGAVTIAFGANPAAGTLAGTTTVNAVSGVATFSNLSVTRASSGYTLVATSGSLTAAPAVSLVVNAASATALAYSTQPSTSGAGAPITPAVAVNAVDSFGNLVTSFAGTVTVAIANNPSAGVLSGTTSATAAGGTATFSNLRINNTGTGYTLIASSGSLTSVISTPFNITTANIQWINGSGGSWSNPANWNLNRVPLGSDSVAITLAGTYTVQLDTTFTGGYITVGGTSGTQTLALSGGRTLMTSAALTIDNNGVFALDGSTVAGSGFLVNGGNVSTRNGTITTQIVNSGTIISNGVSAYSALTSNAASVLRLQADGSTGQTVLNLNSFANNGVLDLTSTVGGYPALLQVAGTLTNNGSGAITSSVGAGGTRTISGRLVNNGTVTVNAALSLVNTSAASTNAGTISVTGGDLSVTQAGSSPSFTNSGTITVGSGRTFTVSNGTFGQSSGATLNGGGALALNSVVATFNTTFTLAALTASSASLDFSQPLSTTGLVVALDNSTVSGAGAITNVAGQTLSARNSSIGNSITNNGTIVVNGSGAFTGTYANAASATLLVQPDGSTGTATLTISNGFTNSGTINLSSTVGGYPATLAVTNGTLLNASGGVIRTSVGAGGNRNIAAELNNQGSLVVNQPLTLGTSSSVADANTGTITAAADLTISLTGSSTFTNGGAINVAASHIVAVNGGQFTEGSGGTFTGSGQLNVFNSTATLTGTLAVSSLVVNTSVLNVPANFSTAVTDLALVNATVQGAGSLTNASGHTISVRNGSIGIAVANQGTLLLNGTMSISGSFANTSSGIVTLQSDGSTGVVDVTLANGFTNSGLIDLTSTVGGYPAFLRVTSGTLTNAAGASIVASAGAGGNRTIAAQINNVGTITLNTALAIANVSSASTSSGTINVSGGDLSVNQSGTSPSFTNTGTLTIASGRTASINVGTFTQASGATINGGGALVLQFGTFTLNTPVTLSALTVYAANGTFNQNVSTSGLTLSITNSTIGGTGAFTNVAGQTMFITSSAISNPITNSGTLIANGNPGLTGTYVNNAGSTLRLQSNGSTGVATLIIANGFTNDGTIDLTSTVGGYPATLIVSAGTLLNSGTGVIQSSVGAGGTRELRTALNNQGSLSINQSLLLDGISAIHTNSGTITLNTGNLQIDQAGTSPSFTNTGTLTVNPAQTLTVNGGTFTENASGTLNGNGMFLVNNTTSTFNNPFTMSAFTATSSNVAFNTATTTAGATYTLVNSTISGTGIVTNAPGQFLYITGGTFGSPLNNRGETVLNGTVNFTTSSIANNATGTFRLRSDGSTGTSNVTFASGFSNNGLIDLTSSVGAYPATLTFTSGTLTNSASGILQSSVGAGGTRTVNGSISNGGTINVGVGGTGTLNQTSGNITNQSAGIINLKLASAANFDQIQSTGTFIQLGGTLNVSASYTPASGSNFQLISSPSMPGSFATTNLPSGFTPNQTATTYNIVKP